MFWNNIWYHLLEIKNHSYFDRSFLEIEQCALAWLYTWFMPGIANWLEARRPTHSLPALKEYYTITTITQPAPAHTRTQEHNGYEKDKNSTRNMSGITFHRLNVGWIFFTGAHKAIAIFKSYQHTCTHRYSPNWFWKWGIHFKINANYMYATRDISN